MSIGGGFVNPSGGGYLFPAARAGGGGGGSGTVTSVTADGTSITVAGTAADPTVALNLANANVWTAAQTLALEDAGTNTVLRPLIVRHTSSGTPTTLFGAGFSLFAHDASNNLDEAGSYDSFWTTATDGGTQQSVLSGRARVANAMTELYRIGGGTTVSALDVNGFLSVGRCLIDNRADDIAYFSHRDRSTTSNYALFQNAAGATRLNCESGQTITVLYNATQRMHVNSVGIGFHATNGVAAQTSGANLTNNVTSGGTDNTVDNWTDLTVYATDAAAIRNAIYQLSRKLKQVNDGLRTYGLFT